MKDSRIMQNEELTVGKLKEILASFPDSAPVRIEDHYVGYGLRATVFKRISAKNVRGLIEQDSSASLAFFSDNIAEKIEAGENPRLITQEQEDNAPFELKAAFL